MLQKIVCHPALRRGGMPARSLYARFAAIRGVKDHSAHPERPEGIKKTMSTKQELHRTKTPDPNAEERDGLKRTKSTLQKTKSGFHTSSGRAWIGRDSWPSMLAFGLFLFGAPACVGWFTNPGDTWYGGAQMNQILRRQTDIKHEYGKGGGGWGTGAGGEGYSQRKPELGFTDKHRTRDLNEDQPEVIQGHSSWDKPGMEPGHNPLTKEKGARLPGQ